MLRPIAALVVLMALCAPAFAQLPQDYRYHGKLRIDRPGRGQIDLNTGEAGFKVKRWVFLPSADSDGINPGTEQVTIGIADEKFVLPVGSVKVSKNGKKFSYHAKTTRGVQNFRMVFDSSTGDYKVKLLQVAGVDLSTLVISDPPICLGFAIIIGNDDGFSGVDFDRPKPFPSKLLTLPGFCDATTDWPWL
jgi:hypothetical protein